MREINSKSGLNNSLCNLIFSGNMNSYEQYVILNIELSIVFMK